MPGSADSEDSTSGESPIRRGSPLPWLLLGVTVAVTIGVFAMAHVRVDAEKLRTANALKANDEVQGRLKTAVNDMQEAQVKVDQLEVSNRALAKQIEELDAQNKSLQDELDKLKKKSPPKK